MTDNAQPIRLSKAVRRKAVTGLATGLLLLALGAGSVAAAATGGGKGATPFAATFEARTARAQVASCAALGPEGKKLAARYDGTFSVARDDRRLSMRVSLEILVDGRTGVGTASGTWRLIDPSDAAVVGKGELVAVVSTATPPDPEVDPPDPDLQLRGLLLGQLDPPHPDLSDQRLIANFIATLADGGLAFSGSVGDGAGDPPSEGELVPAVLVAVGSC